MSTAVDGQASEHVVIHEAQASVWAVTVVVAQPVGHGDGDIFVVMGPPPVGELPPEAGVEGLDRVTLNGAM